MSNGGSRSMGRLAARRTANGAPRRSRIWNLCARIFLRVEQLLNRAAKFLPEVTVQGESRRVWVGLKFRFGYWMARQQIVLGLDVATRLKNLAQKLQTLSDCADAALSQVAREYGLPVLQSDLNR
jgi:hypothetical protein